MGKIKEEPMDEDKKDIIKSEPQTYEDKLEHCSIIAKPMASRKLTKKIYKLIKKSTGHKNYIRNGLKLVQKQLRLGEKGIVIFAGDISPIEIMCHLPAVCEEKEIPYCYTPCRKDIGAAMGANRGCIMVLVKEHEDYKELYDEIQSEIKVLGHPL